MELTQMEKYLISGLHVLEVPTEVIVGILSTLTEEVQQRKLMDYLAQYRKELRESSETDRVAEILGVTADIVQEESDFD